MAEAQQIRLADITGMVLAGGRGTRMGGVDKGLQPFSGQPLALHALRRLQPQVGRASINANRNIEAYQAFGVPVWPDITPDYAGPLAGMLAGLQHCETPWLVTVPCDTPNFPPDLVQRLAAAALAEDAEIAMAFAPEADPATGMLLSAQPVFSLMRAGLRASLQAFMADGGRKVGAWAKGHRLARVAFDTPSDDGHAFFNANTLAELQALAGGSLV